MSVSFTLSSTGTLVDDLLAMNARVLPEMTRRDHAAWVMNVLAHLVGTVFARWDSEGRSLVAVGAEGCGLIGRIAPENRLIFEVVTEAPPVTALATAPAVTIAVAGLFAPSANALAYAGPLEPRALWRIAGDGLAWGWMRAGQPDRAGDVLCRYGAPFANRQLLVAADHIARRGGCCRYLSV